MGPKVNPESEYQGRATSVRFQAAVMRAIEKACRVTQIPPSTFIRAAVLEKLYRDGFWDPDKPESSQR